MLQTLDLSLASALGAATSPEQERLGVYVVAAIVGILVSGVISCVKEMRRELVRHP